MSTATKHKHHHQLSYSMKFYKDGKFLLKTVTVCKDSVDDKRCNNFKETITEVAK